MKSSVSAGLRTRILQGAALAATSCLILILVTSMAKASAPKVGEKAPDFELKTIDNGKVKLSTLLKKGPVVVVVLRGYPGYQCPICTAQVGSLIGKSEKFEAAKAQVVLVYPGESEGLKQHADEFVRGKNLPKSFQLALDPNYDFTKKYNLRWDAPNETAFPSTFVVDRKDSVLFARVSHSHADRAKTDEILKSLGQ